MENVEAKFEPNDHHDPLAQSIAGAASEAYDEAEELLTKMASDGGRLLSNIVAEHGIEMTDYIAEGAEVRALVGDDFVAYCKAKEHVIKATLILAKIVSGKSKEVVQPRH